METLLALVIKDVVPGVIEAIRARHAQGDPSLPPLTDAEALAIFDQASQSTLAKDAAWLQAHGMQASVGSYSDREFYLDAPMAFVDFVVEAMTPELADYDVRMP